MPRDCATSELSTVDHKACARHPRSVILRPALFAAPLALPLALLLASCGGNMVPPGRATPSPSTKPPARTSVPRPAPVQRPTAQVQIAPGLEGVIGADALQLGRVFGTPRLDVIEDDARKLQWSGTACILDVYLYPPASGGRPTATYVEARRGDGREVDRAACISALRKAP